MIIWSGFGFLAGVIPVLCYMGIVKLCQLQYGVPYCDAHGWPGALGTLLGALLVYVVASKLAGPGRTLVDPRTGETVTLRRRHTLFFIPMEWWAGILVFVAIWMVALKRSSPL